MDIRERTDLIILPDEMRISVIEETENTRKGKQHHRKITGSQILQLVARSSPSLPMKSLEPKDIKWDIRTKLPISEDPKEERSTSNTTNPLLDNILKEKGAIKTTLKDPKLEIPERDVCPMKDDYNEPSPPEIAAVKDFGR